VGGKPKNRHGKYGVGGRADLPPKTPVLALIEKESGTVPSCKMTDSQRVEMMIARSAGRRLSYRPLTERSQNRRSKVSRNWP
jgi:hypothetical protein